MRQLSDKEKELNNNSIKRLTKEIEHAEYLIEVEELQLRKGLRLSYEANIISTENKMKNYKATMESNTKQILILKEQNTKGVKEKKLKGSDYTG